MQSVIDGRGFESSSMVGTGLTMEGIDQNYIVYDHMLEMGWKNRTFDLNNWYDEYIVRRYGANDSSVTKAWRLLQRGVYDGTTTVELHDKLYIIATRPSLDANPSVSIV